MNSATNMSTALTGKPERTTSSAPRLSIPPAFFAAALGLSGLSALWQFAAESIGAPHAAGDVIAVVGAVVLCILACCYARQGPRHLLADAKDTAAGPLLAAPVMSGLILGVVLGDHARVAGHVVVIVLLVVATLMAGLLLGQWFTGGLEQDKLGPAIYLGGGGLTFVGTQAAAAIGHHQIAEAFFGIGVISWVHVSSVVLGRVFLRPRLAPALFPSMAIELATPAVGGSAYFALHPGRPDAFAFAIAGYAAVILIAQVRLLPLYGRLSFSPSFWSFTFPAAATATLALHWLAVEHPAGHKVYAWIIVGFATALVAAIAVRSCLGIARWVQSQLAGMTPASVTRNS
jgi:tellurite resistance protein